MYHKYDEDRIQDAKEDIDTLLVFVCIIPSSCSFVTLTTICQAGLFSAVLSAFLIETYSNLSEDSNEVNTRVLMQISSQLASLSQSGSFINSTVPAFVHSPSFSPQPSSVRINALWSCSLVISLITASLGILVKQWFHEFMAQGTQDPTYRIRIRFFRSEGLERWQVFEIAAALPLLLQIALLLFFVGLSEFLRELNSIVGWATTGTILGWLAVFTFTTLAPMVSSQCPYKTPMLKRPLGYLRPIVQRVYGFIKRYLIGTLWILLYGLIYELIRLCFIGGTSAFSGARRYLLPIIQASFESWISQVQTPSGRLRDSLSEWTRWICVILASFVVLAPIFAVLLPLGVATLVLKILFEMTYLFVMLSCIILPDTSSWKYMPEAEESKIQGSEETDSTIILGSDPFFRDRQLRGTLLECAECVPAKYLAGALYSVQSRSWCLDESLVLDMLLQNSKIGVKDRSWTEALISVIKDRRSTREKILPTLVIQVARADSDYGAGVVFSAIYSSLVDDQGAVYQYLVGRFSGLTRHGDTQCRHSLSVC